MYFEEKDEFVKKLIVIIIREDVVLVKVFWGMKFEEVILKMMYKLLWY